MENLNPYEFTIVQILKTSPRRLTTLEIVEFGNMNWATADKYCKRLHNRKIINAQIFRNRHYWSSWDKTEKFNIYEEKILNTIIKGRRPLTTKQISEFSGISYNTVRKHLDELNKKGFVKMMPLSNRIYWSL